MSATSVDTPTLSSVIRSVLTEASFVTPDEVADEVVRRTPPKLLRDFYREAVRDRARVQMHGLPAPRPEPQGQPRSAKVQAIRDMHQKRLASLVSVNGEWKRFGECSHEDVLALAAERQAMAIANANRAEQFRRVAKELANRGAATVADLPADVLDSALEAGR